MNSVPIQTMIQAALAHHLAGRLAEAGRGYEQILLMAPGNADALRLAGTLAFQQGNASLAIELIGRSIQSNPRFADSYFNLARIYAHLHRFADAAEQSRKFLILKPRFADGWVQHQHHLRAMQAGDRAEMSRRCAELLSAMPPNREIDSASIQALIEFLQIALDLSGPGAASDWVTIGNALLLDGLLAAAAECFREAITIDPQSVAAHDNLGTALRELNHIGQAIESHRRAIDIEPDYAGGHFNLGLSLLLSGDLADGFAEYEWRWKTDRFRQLRRDFSQPLWDGSALNGKRILLHAEQGFGDAIQFSRYCRIVKERGGEVILSCQPELVDLLRTVAGVDEVTSEQWPGFAVHCPLLSLPHVLGTAWESIPVSSQYLRAMEDRRSRWRKRLHEQAGQAGIRVGLCWAGRATHLYDARRSIDPQLLAPFSNVPGVHWIILQKEPGEGNSGLPLPASSYSDWTGELTDFAESAALVSELDLVITIDSAIAHLAGALGKTVWTMLPHVPDWRWLRERSNSPWYPSMRLFRQRRLGEWEETIRDVVGELSAFAMSRA